MAKKNEITKKDDNTLAKSHEVGNMFGNEQPILIDVAPPQISILRESQQFEMPNGKKVDEFVAHILYWHNANQFYKVAFDDRKPEDSKFPNCLSVDGIRSCESDEESYDRQEASCLGCPKNEYGSDPDGGKGKACQNTIRMALLLDGQVVPCLIKAPPSSLSKKDSLKSWLVNAPNESMEVGCGDAYQVIKVHFSLEKKDFGGKTASILILETQSVLTPKDDMDEIMNLVEVSKAFKLSYLGSVATHMQNEGGNDAQPEGENPPI